MISLTKLQMTIPPNISMILKQCFQKGRTCFPFKNWYVFKPVSQLLILLLDTMISLCYYIQLAVQGSGIWCSSILHWTINLRIHILCDVSFKYFSLKFFEFFKKFWILQKWAGPNDSVAIRRVCMNFANFNQINSLNHLLKPTLSSNSKK